MKDTGGNHAPQSETCGPSFEYFRTLYNVFVVEECSRCNIFVAYHLSFPISFLY